MSRGLSWRQTWMLKSIAQQCAKLSSPRHRVDVVAWKSINYGPHADTNGDARAEWNIEQAMRRALRSLERRGLVELDRYVFHAYADMIRGDMSPEIYYVVSRPDSHVPGQSRIMTGVRLTPAGAALVAAAEAVRAEPVRPRHRRA